MQKFVGKAEFDRFERLSTPTALGRLLVTGGTGFIGGAVLAELLGSPYWSQTCFLVRAPTVAAARERMAESIERFCPEIDAARLVRDDQILLGGLEDFDLHASDPRLCEITHVIHAAAVTSFSKSPRIRAINVDASLAFVALLASGGRLQRFVNVGTAWCVGLGTDRVVQEGRLHSAGDHVVPYTESKLAFEREVELRFPDLPFVTARPSIVVGHVQLGTRPSGSIYWVFRTASLMGKYTCTLDDRIDVVPVDWVAEALVTLATKPELRHRAYHLSSGAAYASTVEQIDAAIARGRNTEAHGRGRYRCVDEVQLTKIIYDQREKFGGTSPLLLSKAMKIYGRFASSGTVFDNAHTLEEGIPPPPPFYTYADVCASTAEETSIASQMEDDFK